jgi:hypothetical protein
VVARSALAALIYLLPIPVVFALRARDDRSLWEVAGDVPLAVAVDLLLVLLLSRLMVLDMAALTSRAGWLVVAAGGALWRRRGGRGFSWPRALDARIVVQAGVLALLALGLSLTLSRTCAIWDRDWHIPLVASLGGQRLPFRNVYGADAGLYYHFTGDVLAAMLRAFSGNALHASLALSLAHDLVFALLGAALAFFVGALGVRRLPLAVVVAGATLLAGPVTLLRESYRRLESGYSIQNLLSLSFRPHVSLAYLFILGVVAAVLARLRDLRAPASAWRLWPLLAAPVAALALTDEASLVLLALGLAALWLADGRAFGADRRAGALLLGSLAALVVVTLLVFVGAVGPHAPRHALALVPPRSPGFLAPPIPFSLASGAELAAQDLAPIALVGAAGGLLCARAGRPLRLSVLFYGVVLLTGLFALTCTEVDHLAPEGHRWATAASVIAPLLAASWLADTFRARGAAALGGWAALLVYLGSSLGVASTVEWLASGVAERTCRRDQGFKGFASDRFYDVDCRSATGARLGERPRPTYVEPEGAYLYAGCRPTFLSGATASPHAVQVGRPGFGGAALADVGSRLPPAEPLAIACLSAAAPGDYVCPAAASRAPCAPAGTMFMVCEAPAAAWRQIAAAEPTPARRGR